MPGRAVAVRWVVLAAMPAGLVSENDPACASTDGGCAAPWGSAVEAEVEAAERSEVDAQDFRLLQARSPRVGKQRHEQEDPNHAIWHWARNCLQPTNGEAVCNVPGMCEHYCGPGNACCRKFSTTDPPECQGVTLFPVQGYHTCVQASQVPTEAPTPAPTAAAPSTTEAASTTTESKMDCGDHNVVSQDCVEAFADIKLDYDKYKEVCDRCATEGGASPLRSRCTLCCTMCPPPSMPTV